MLYQNNESPHFIQLNPWIFSYNFDHWKIVESAGEVAVVDLCLNSLITLDDIRGATTDDQEDC